MRKEAEHAGKASDKEPSDSEDLVTKNAEPVTKDTPNLDPGPGNTSEAVQNLYSNLDRTAQQHQPSDLDFHNTVENESVSENMSSKGENL